MSSGSAHFSEAAQLAHKGCFWLYSYTILVVLGCFCSLQRRWCNIILLVLLLIDKIYGGKFICCSHMLLLLHRSPFFCQYVKTTNRQGMHAIHVLVGSCLVIKVLEQKSCVMGILVIWYFSDFGALIFQRDILHSEEMLQVIVLEQCTS